MRKIYLSGLVFELMMVGTYFIVGPDKSHIVKKRGRREMT